MHALSDLHLDYAENRRWVSSLSAHDYQDDILILAGDLATRERWLLFGFGALAARFRQVLYVPGNHELWTHPQQHGITSFERFEGVCAHAFGVESICRVLPIAPSTYHRHRQAQADPALRSARAQRDNTLRVEIQRVYDEHHQVYGPARSGSRCGAKESARRAARSGA